MSRVNKAYTTSGPVSRLSGGGGRGMVGGEEGDLESFNMCTSQI